MTGIPQELVTRCHEVLSRCDEFESHQRLRAVFVTEELVIYQNGLPEARSKAERVSATVDYLRLKYLKSAQPILPFLLAALHELHDAEDGLKAELESLQIDVQQTLSAVQTIEIPLVIMAMKQEEASELLNESFFDNPEMAPIERIRFDELKQSLNEHGIQDWDSHYQAQRDLWKPHTASDRTIHDIVVQIIDHLNLCEREPKKLKIIRHRSYSEEFFSQNYHQQSDTWDHLKQSGGVIIIDAVSLFHPVLRNTLIQSGLTSEEKIAVMVMSPLSSGHIPVNIKIENLLKTQIKPIFSRCEERLDRFCEIGDGNVRFLQRWLFGRLSQTADIVKEQTMITNRRFIRQIIEPQTGEIDQAIFRKK